jgi:chemotaxis protein MotB
MSVGGGGRKRLEEVHENHERWLLTYADMITLLLALFIILVGASKTDPHKYDQVAQSFHQAFSTAPAGDTILNPGHGRDTTVIDQSSLNKTMAQNTQLKNQNQSVATQNGSLQDKLQQSMQTLDQIQQQIAASKQAQDFLKSNKQLSQLKVDVQSFLADHSTLRSQVQIRIDGRGLVLQILPDKVLFQSGQAVLRPEASTLLDPLARLLSLQPNAIRVEGHTDNQPIATSQFPSNWELSTARATSVVRYLISHKVTPVKVSAAGYADTHPLVSNRTIRGRALNRRIEIIVLRSSPDSKATYEAHP